MAYLARVRISEQAHKYPSQLSGGQQQRVAIARALCMEPRVMLFDEPTSALDPEMIKEVLDVMIELAQEHMTMICVTHEMGFARTVADTMVFMDHGQIVETAPPAGLLRHSEERADQAVPEPGAGALTLSDSLPSRPLRAAVSAGGCVGAGMFTCSRFLHEYACTKENDRRRVPGLGRGAGRALGAL